MRKIFFIFLLFLTACNVAGIQQTLQKNSNDQVVGYAKRNGYSMNLVETTTLPHGVDGKNNNTLSKVEGCYPQPGPAQQGNLRPYRCYRYFRIVIGNLIIILEDQVKVRAFINSVPFRDPVRLDSGKYLEFFKKFQIEDLVTEKLRETSSLFFSVNEITGTISN